MAEKKISRSWSDVENENSRSNFYELYDRYAIPDDPKHWTQMRLLGEVYELRLHWIPVNKKGGGGQASYPLLCRRNWDEAAECPCCDVELRTQKVYLSNAIIRDEQENEPRNAKSPPKGAKVRKRGDKWWSPVYIVQFSQGTAMKIANLKDLNKHLDKKTGKPKKYDMNHPSFGCDLMVSFDSSQTGASMYSVQKGDKTKLTEDERGYLLYSLDGLPEYVPSVDTMVSSIARAYNDELLNDKNCNLKAVRSLVRGSGKLKSKSDDIDDDDDDDDDRPRKKKGDKAKAKPRRRSDDDFDDDDIDDDDDDDRPKKKGKSRRDDDDRPKKKGKSRRDDDDDDDNFDDDDFDDDFDDDDDDRPKKKGKSRRDDDRSKKKSSKKRNSRDEDTRHRKSSKKKR